MRISQLRGKLSDYFPDADTYARDIIHSELGGIVWMRQLKWGWSQMRSGKQ